MLTPRPLLCAPATQVAEQVALPGRELEQLRGLYNELLYAVARKFDGETRHETALRYIREAEARVVLISDCREAC